MKKRLFLIGLLMLILGAFLAYESGQQFISGLAGVNNTATSELYLNSSNTAYLPIQVNASSFLEIGYNSSNAINFYLVNASAFASMRQYLNSTNALDAKAIALEGNGTAFVMENRSGAEFPYQSTYAGLLPTPNYQAGSGTPVAPSTYYAIFRNTGSSTDVIVYYFFSRPISAISFTSGSFFGYGLVSGILLIVGFALSIYALITKPEQSERVKATEENINRLYGNIDKEQRKGMQKKRSARHKAKRRKKE